MQNRWNFLKTGFYEGINIDEALSVIERDFCNHDGLGPIAASQFITQGLDDNVQADVVGHAQELLRSLGRL